jgi:hypothetical protein
VDFFFSLSHKKNEETCNEETGIKQSPSSHIDERQFQESLAVGATMMKCWHVIGQQQKNTA